MALPHLTAGQVIDIKPLRSGLATARTAALFKSRDLEVMRLVLLAGKSLPAHKLAGEVTIQCLEGRLSIDLDGLASTLEAGELMLLAGGMMHGVTAISDASALVTIALGSG
jgi:quercetin dioxygenase-like cupin family protein